MTNAQSIGTPKRRRGGPIAFLLQVLDTRRQRRALMDLDDAMLRDIGLTRHQAMFEADRPLWDVPATWQK